MEGYEATAWHGVSDPTQSIDEGGFYTDTGSNMQVAYKTGEGVLLELDYAEHKAAHPSTQRQRSG